MSTRMVHFTAPEISELAIKEAARITGVPCDLLEARCTPNGEYIVSRKDRVDLDILPITKKRHGSQLAADIDEARSTSGGPANLAYWETH